MAKEARTMSNWLKTTMAVGMAVALFGAGAAFAKHDDDDHGHGHGKGKSHEHGRAGQNDQGDDGGSKHGSHGKGGGNGNGNGGGSANACDAASSAIMAFVDMTCPCAGVDDGNGGTTAWKNHGQYVRCVSHAVRDAARAAGVKRRCAKSLVPCAANSSCGKKNAVACVVGTECAVVSADRCTAAGGSASSGSCCTASPNGAFLD
jgi:hypothetical protein